MRDLIQSLVAPVDRMLACLFVLSVPLGFAQQPNAVPARYYKLLEEGVARVDARLAAEPGASLSSLEAQPGWTHFPSAILAAAVLYTKAHPANTHRGEPKMLQLALKAGDLVEGEQQGGTNATPLDHRDTYMWLEGYRLIERELGEERRERWRRALIALITQLAAGVAEREDYPLYQSPFIGTSPNHYSLWSSTVYLAGRVFGNKGWEKLGAKVMHRFAAEEQSADGYWGEHSSAGPTTGYDNLTLTGVAEYWEHSHDRSALEALHRSTDFHEYFTYLDGTPVETVNDRNRYWDVAMWGHFAFSNFPDGRRYAQFLAERHSGFSMEALGRIAQNALYFHVGSLAKIPQDRERSAHQMSVPAGIRKTGPWVICLSGIIATQAPTSQFYLDRQSHLSVFHQKCGLVITGANSKRQPELATIVEEAGGQICHMPMSSRLEMTDREDRLSLAYNTFFVVLGVPPPSNNRASFTFAVTPRGHMANSRLTLQLVLHAGETLETENGLNILDETPQRLDVAGWIRHHGWTLKLRTPARLTWPVRPYDPYSNGPEPGIEHAVGALTTQLDGEKQLVPFVIEVE
jgi:hypothetical protein